MKIIDCVFQALSFPFQRWLSWGEPRLQCTRSHTLDPCRNKPFLFISLPAHPPPTNPMYISQNPHIRIHKSFWHLLCYAFFFLKVVENWDLPQSRKTGNHEEYLGKNAIWREKKKNEEEYKQITVTLSNYFSNGN